MVRRYLGGEEDPLTALVYREALRGLVQQQGGIVENMNPRADNLIFAAAFVSSMLSNWRIIQRLRLALQLALILFLLEILAWLAAIAAG